MLNQQSKIFISGASDGLGKAIALDLASRTSCFLALCGRNEQKLRDVLRQINEINPEIKVLAAAFDATDETACKQFADHVLSQFGSIDILINNAGANLKKSPVAEIDLSQLKAMFDLNCVAPLIFIQKFLPAMKEKKDGLIVDILSSVCLHDNMNVAAYTASKQAMNAIHKALVKEVREDNIKVSGIYPGGINTHFRELERPDYLDPEKLAKVIVDTLFLEDGVVHDLVIRPMVENNF